MRSTLDRFLPYYWKINTLSLVDLMQKELGRMNYSKRVFSFKKKNGVHEKGNKIYIDDFPLKIPVETCFSILLKLKNFQHIFYPRAFILGELLVYLR